ncbi:MAG: hypothetical protein DHS20C15_07060 [Planctomycetota bacterium]|nr:MAG: hypothetical protein DHS20C15_07060 [Planctomycetota bacterium]
MESVGFDQRGDAATRAEHSGAISAATDGTAQRGLRASDVASPEALVRACYDVISGPAGPRDWERFLALFHPEFGRLVPVRTSRDGSTHSVFGITPAQYVENASVTFEANAFYERELSLRVQRFGAVAHAFSAYASYTSDAPDAEPVDRGVNSFQLFFDGARWFVLSISWDSEREGVVLEVG